MRALILVPSLRGGGAEAVALEWARYLARHKHNVTVVCTSDSGIEPEIESFDIIQMRQKSGMTLLNAHMDLRRLLVTKQIEIVLSLMPLWNLQALIACNYPKKLRGVKVVISEHNIHAILGPLFGRGFALQRRLARVLYKRADAVVAVSHPVAAEMVSQYKVAPGRIWVVPNPALGAWSPTPESSMRHAANGEPVRIVFTGRLVQQKRPLIAVEVAAKLQTDLQRDVCLTVFGDGPLRSQMEDLASARRVDLDFRGWTDAWTVSCPRPSILLLPSVSEGFGNVLVEAAAIGVTSVVSSRSIGAADACIPGITAQLVAGDRVDDYVDGVKAAMDMPMPNVSQWLSRFTQDKAGSVLLEVLTSVQPVGASR